MTREEAIIFLVGLLFGLSLTVVWRRTQTFTESNALSHHYRWHETHDITDPPKGRAVAAGFAPLSQHFHSDQNSSIAQDLFKRIRIFCFILTSPKSQKTRARHVKHTWAQRCNTYVFISGGIPDPTLPTIELGIPEGRNSLWGKTKAAFKYAFQHHYETHDWFLKADDDTYVIVENLRFMLAAYSPNEPIYLGKRFKALVRQGYMSGGAGYVLSREALRRFVEIALHHQPGAAGYCRTNDDKGAEDAEIGRCLESVGVVAGDSRDEHNRSRYFPFVIEHHVVPGFMGPNHWYHRYTYDAEKEGFECCSDYAIAFHYIPPAKMYLYDFLIYHLRPFGLTYNFTMPKRRSAMEKKHSAESGLLPSNDIRSGKPLAPL